MQNRVGEMKSAVEHYYNVNKILMLKLGIWPAQSIFVKMVYTALFTALVFSIGFLEFVRLLEVLDRLTEDCESFIMMLLAIGAHFKLYIIMVKNKDIEHLLSLIDYHWRIFTHSLEIQIMQEYAIIGRKITIGYAVLMYSLAILYMMMPLMPLILDFLIPLNTSRPYMHLFDVDYSFDRDVYYYPVLFHAYITIVIGITSLVIADTCYMMFAQHACSLFAAIGHRLENLTATTSLKKCCLVKGDITCNNCETNHDDNIYREMILILRKHQLSLEYVDMMESMFVMYSFFMIMLQLICLSLIGLQIITFLDQTALLIRYIAMTIGGFVHLFVLSYPGQRIMDYSADIFHKAYNMMWYRTSRKMTQLLSILLYRAFVPCTLTAGKMYVLSMENYASVMQGTLSYFTALSSFQ